MGVEDLAYALYFDGSVVAKLVSDLGVARGEDVRFHDLEWIECYGK